MDRQGKQTEAERIEAEIAMALLEAGRGVWRDTATPGLELLRSVADRSATALFRGLVHHTQCNEKRPWGPFWSYRM
jgi:hypothetical protein